MRQKMFAIVDRTQIGVSAGTVSGVPAQSQTVHQSAAAHAVRSAAVLHHGGAAEPDAALDAGRFHHAEHRRRVRRYLRRRDLLRWRAGHHRSVERHLNNRLVIGTGADREIVRGSRRSSTTRPRRRRLPRSRRSRCPTSGNGSLTRSHGPGECVSNFMPCNPGPQQLRPADGQPVALPECGAALVASAVMGK